MSAADFQSMMQSFLQQMQQQQQQQQQQMQQQQVAFQAVAQAMQQILTNDKGHQTSQSVDEKFYKKVENFNGEQNWRDWSFQFKSATKNAQQEAYHLLEWAEKEESEITDDLQLKDKEINISPGIFNILGTIVKGEPLQMLHTSGFSGLEAWRKLSKRYSPTTPMRGMQLMMAAVSPGRAKKLEEIAGHIDRWEAKVLALSRDFEEKLSDKMRAAILVSMLPPGLQQTLVQQADKLSDYKYTKDRIISIVESKLAIKDPDAMDCDAVRHAQDFFEDHHQFHEYDVDAIGGKGGLYCYRCGGQGHIAAKCATPAPPKGTSKGKSGGGKGSKGGGKDAGSKGKGKGGDWHGFCSYCGKRGHGPRDCWTKQKDEANTKMDVGEVEQDVGGFEIGCVFKEYAYPPGLRIHNRFEALGGNHEQHILSVDAGCAKGKITVDSGAAESVWPEDLLPEIETRPSTGSQTGVSYIAANGSRMPNLGEKKVHFKTKDGLNSSITFQVTKVKKPLAAVSKITEKGNWVCFGPGEAYIENIASGKKTSMDLNNGTYSLDVEYFSNEVFTRQDK